MNMNNEKAPIEVAMSIFQKRANYERRSYHGDLVRKNLRNFLNGGNSPQQAVRKLFYWANSK